MSTKIFQPTYGSWEGGLDIRRTLVESRRGSMTLLGLSDQEWTATWVVLSSLLQFCPCWRNSSVFAREPSHENGCRLVQIFECLYLGAPKLICCLWMWGGGGVLLPLYNSTCCPDEVARQCPLQMRLQSILPAFPSLPLLFTIYFYDLKIILRRYIVFTLRINNSWVCK